MFDEWIVLFGSFEVIVWFNYVGYCVVVVINQFGIGCGLFDMVVFNEMYLKMYCVVVVVGVCIDVVFFCLYMVEDYCDCCKLKFGMMQMIVECFEIDLDYMLVVGDLLCDLQVGVVVGFQLYFVLIGKGKKMFVVGNLLFGMKVYDDLCVFVFDFFLYEYE